MSEPVVLMTADAVGGVWTYVLRLAEKLGARGARVVIATMGPLPTAAQAAALSKIPGVELHSASLRLEWMDDPWEDVKRAGDWLLELEAECRADVVHLNGFVHAALPWNAPRMVVAHSCVLSWWRAVHGEAAPVRWARYRTEVARGIDAADAVVAPSWAMLAALAREYGIARHGRVIPNGSDPPHLVSAPKEDVVFSAGRVWDAGKNLVLLSKIAAKIPCNVRVAGSIRAPGGEDTPLEGVECLGLLGSEDIARQMARASIYAHPARYEPFGLSVLEAGLARSALLLSDLPSLREVWEDDAIYLPPNDEDAWIHAVKVLLHATPWRKELGERAHRRALRFSAERMAQGYLDLYADLTTPSRFELACA
jgi:glycosyltransferase involved in cell wall biosynthesis